MKKRGRPKKPKAEKFVKRSITLPASTDSKVGDFAFAYELTYSKAIQIFIDSYKNPR